MRSKLPGWIFPLNGQGWQPLRLNNTSTQALMWKIEDALFPRPRGRHNARLHNFFTRLLLGQICGSTNHEDYVPSSELTYIQAHQLYVKLCYILAHMPPENIVLTYLGGIFIKQLYKQRELLQQHFM